MTVSFKKVALVHDWLNGMRGGEKCLEVFCELFPQADLYTLLYQPGKLSPLIEKHPIHTSFIQKLPFSQTHYRHYLPLFPYAIEQFDLRGYDLILSSSHCVAKGVRSDSHAIHVSYVHAPMRYMWGLFDDYFAPDIVSPWTRWGALAMRPYLQRWDRASAHRVDHFLCNSQNIQKQIELIYQRSATVIHPPVDLSRYRPRSESKKDFYLAVGAFAPNKRMDLAIEAFNELGLPLKIVGTGQNEEKCRALAKGNIEFLGSVSDDVLASLYPQARAFVFPGEDDFGITPLEAQACGTPVIAYAKGGALETVTSETGIFFHHPTVEALKEAVTQIESGTILLLKEACIANAHRFGKERFRDEITSFLGAVDV